MAAALGLSLYSNSQAICVCALLLGFCLCCQRTRKAKGVEGLIEVHNPNKNKQQARNIKVKDMGSLDGKVVLTRRERCVCAFVCVCVTRRV